jgi:hypothetical protein
MLKVARLNPIVINNRGIRIILLRNIMSPCEIILNNTMQDK